MGCIPEPGWNGRQPIPAYIGERVPRRTAAPPQATAGQQQARELVEDSLALARRGDYAGAPQQFMEAEALFPSAETEKALQSLDSEIAKKRRKTLEAAVMAEEEGERADVNICARTRRQPPHKRWNGISVALYEG